MQKVPWSIQKSQLYADLIKLVPVATAKDLLAKLIIDDEKALDKVAEFDLAFCLTDLLKLHKSHLGLFKLLELMEQAYYEIILRDEQFSKVNLEAQSRYKKLVKAELLKVAREVVSWSKSLNPDASREANVDFRLNFVKKLKEFFVLNKFADAKELDRLILSLELDLPVDKGLEAFDPGNLNAQEFAELAEKIKRNSADMDIELRRDLYSRFLKPYVSLNMPELFDLIVGQLDLVLQLYTPGLYPTWLVSLVKNYQIVLGEKDADRLDLDKDLRDKDAIEVFVQGNGVAKLFDGLKMALAHEDYLGVVSVLANMPKYIAKYRDYKFIWRLIDMQPFLTIGELDLSSMNLNSINNFTLAQCRSIVAHLESLLFKTDFSRFHANKGIYDEFGDFKKDPILFKTLIGRLEVLDPTSDLIRRLERAYVWHYWRQNASYIENEGYPELPDNLSFKNQFSFSEAKDKGALKLLSGNLYVADDDYRVDSSLIDKVSQIDVPKEHLNSVGLSLVVDLWSLDFPKNKSNESYHNLTNVGIYFNGLFNLLKGANGDDFEIIFVEWFGHLLETNANIGLVIAFLLDNKFDFLSNKRVEEIVRNYKFNYPMLFEVDVVKPSGEQLSAPMGSPGVGQNAKTVEFEAPVVSPVLQQGVVDIDVPEKSAEVTLRSGFSAFFKRMKSGFSDFVNRRFVPITGALAVSGMALAGFAVYHQMKQDDRKVAEVKIADEGNIDFEKNADVDVLSKGSGRISQEVDAAASTMEDAPSSTYQIAKGDGFEMGFRKAYGLTAKADFKDFLIKLAESNGDKTGVSGYQHFLAGLKLDDADVFGVDGKTVVHPGDSVEVSSQLLAALTVNGGTAQKKKASLDRTDESIDFDGITTQLANVDTGTAVVKLDLGLDAASGLSFDGAEAGVAPVAFALPAARLDIDNLLITGNIVTSSEAKKIADDELTDPDSSLNRAWTEIEVERTYAEVAKGWEEISSDLALADPDSELNRGWFDDIGSNWAVG